MNNVTIMVYIMNTTDMPYLPAVALTYDLLINHNHAPLMNMMVHVPCIRVD